MATIQDVDPADKPMTFLTGHMASDLTRDLKAQRLVNVGMVFRLSDLGMDFEHVADCHFFQVTSEREPTKKHLVTNIIHCPQFRTCTCADYTTAKSFMYVCKPEKAAVLYSAPAECGIFNNPTSVVY